MCDADAIDTLPPEIIVLTHPDFWIALKPPGLSFHDESGKAGFVSLFRQRVGGAPLYPVHRLDRLTSGLIVLARSAEAARRFGEMFASGAVEKYYLAISAQAPAKKQGCVKGVMQKGRGGCWRLTRGADGPRAITQFFSFSAGGMRVFVVRPRTGRTHQIRVALKSLGAPILGDERYGGAAADRGYLHAFALRFMWAGSPVCCVVSPSIGQVFMRTAVQEVVQSLVEPWRLAWPQQGVDAGMGWTDA